METSELLKKIINLPIMSASLAEEMLAGNFRSVFKGHGMEFDEARHYQIGDDVRSIDWNASARFGTPFVKMYREEKELNIFLLLDISPSMFRGGISHKVCFTDRHDSTLPLSPYEQALISCALIAFSAEHTDQMAGGLFFDNGIEKIFVPRKGRRHIMSLITAALRLQSEKLIQKKTNTSSNLKEALQGAGRLLKKRSLIIIISDFYCMNWEDELTNLCRKHDCIAIRISDPPEIPFRGLITLEDMETGVKIEAPAGMNSFKKNWILRQTQRTANWEAQCKRTGASYLDLRVDADAAAVLFKFFGSRKKL